MTKDVKKGLNINTTARVIQSLGDDTIKEMAKECEQPQIFEKIIRDMKKSVGLGTDLASHALWSWD